MSKLEEIVQRGTKWYKWNDENSRWDVFSYDDYYKYNKYYDESYKDANKNEVLKEDDYNEELMKGEKELQKKEKSLKKEQEKFKIEQEKLEEERKKIEEEKKIVEAEKAKLVEIYNKIQEIELKKPENQEDMKLLG